MFPIVPLLPWGTGVRQWPGTRTTAQHHPKPCQSRRPGPVERPFPEPPPVRSVNHRAGQATRSAPVIVHHAIGFSFSQVLFFALQAGPLPKKNSFFSRFSQPARSDPPPLKPVNPPSPPPPQVAGGGPQPLLLRRRRAGRPRAPSGRRGPFRRRPVLDRPSPPAFQSPPWTRQSREASFEGRTPASRIFFIH